MVKQTTDKSQHHVVFELLPWHVNGTLAADQSRLVQEHIQQCAECQAEITLLTLSYSAANTGATTYPDVEYGLASVMQRIEQAEAGERAARRPRSVSFGGLLDKIADFAHQLTPTGWAAATAIILVAVLGVHISTNQTPPDYQTLSSSTADASPLKLSVQFTDHMETSDVERVVDATSVAFELHRKTDRHYIIELTDPSQVTAMNDLLRTLSSNQDVENIQIVTDGHLGDPQ